ncbi:MAG: hypothetical protein ACRDK8_09265, partial [Solirubrobacteraceae bacterium]
MTPTPSRVKPLRARALALLVGALAFVCAVAGLSASPGAARAAGSSSGRTFITVLNTSVSN